MPVQRAQQLLEAAPDAMVVIDNRGTITLVNAACERLFGYTRAELLGKPVEILLPVSLAGRHVGLRNGYIARPTPRAMGEAGQELRARRKDGSEIPVEISLSPVESPEGLLVVSAVRDVSDRKRAEQEQRLAELALRESEERLAAAARGANVGLWDVDPRSGVILVNEVFETQLGYPPLALRETSEKWSRLRGGLAAWPELIHPDDRDAVVAAIARYLAGETEVYRAEHRVRVPDGSHRWILSVGNSVERDAAGHPLRVNGVHIDITEMKGLQAALEHARDAAEAATRAKSDFLANMSHEIRTPMNAIMGMTHLALQTSLTPQQEDYLVKAHNAAEALLGIINDILDFSKIEAGMLQIEQVDFSLDEVLEGIASLIADKAEQKKLQLRFDRPNDVPVALRGDPLRLSQILVNLANNAVKFTDAGEIVLSVRVEGRERDSVTLRFSVRDTGIGLTEEQVGRLFRAFSQADTSTTRRYGGTGLGLSICKSLTAMMGGRIWVESRPGAGSEFFFTATFGAGGQADRAGAVDVVEVDSLRGARILLVEDNEINQQLAREILEQAGLVVVLASDGREAVDAVTRVKYDAVLMDIQMPSMDGHEAARRIREWESAAAAGATPIIAMTAHAMLGDIEKSRPRG
jgi:two-component system, sensor histidine kinase and response regulator